MGQTIDQTLHHPRILCLHGGGTNARIFRAQCRTLSRALEPHFRLAYAEAPYPSTAGPDVLSVYASEGPFKRWLPWLKEHVQNQVAVDDATAVRDIDAAIKRAMDDDDATGADGPWVAIIGFSQGAKLAASLLFRQQQRLQRREDETNKDKAEEEDDGIYDGWKFVVPMAGRAPIVDLEPHIFKSPLLAKPTQIELGVIQDTKGVPGDAHVLRLPSIHVHGLADPGLHLHQELYERYSDASCTKLIQWDGGHRVVLKSTDVQPIVDAILQMAKETGVKLP
jgi:hypothetical protein